MYTVHSADKFHSKVDSEMSEQATEQQKETKSARTSFLLYPSVYKDFQTLADALHVSPSELLNTIMKEYVDGHRDIIGKWIEYRQAAEAAFKKK